MQYFNYHIPYHPFTRLQSDIRYLPITNYQECKNARKGDMVILYGHDVRGFISRIGCCEVNGRLVKYSKIPEQNRKYCTETNLMQLPVKDVHARGYGMDGLLMQYAGFYMKNIPFKAYKIKQQYYFCSFGGEMFYKRFWYVWRFCNDDDVREQYRRLVVHLYRDKMMDEYATYIRFMYNRRLRCDVCGMMLPQHSLGTNRFFELHNTETNIMHPFRKLDKNKFIMVCPSCHAKLHNAMIPEDVTEHKWDPGFDIYYGMLCGWSENLVDEFNQDYELAIK